MDKVASVDVDQSILGRILGYGTLHVIGTGGAQVDDCLRQLLATGYDAWIVVEQDRVLAEGESFDRALESAERNRNWLKERGL